MEEKKVRIVLAKLGLDDHSRPLYVLSKAFRDAGMEVINLGLYQTPELVVKAAMAEDADAIGLSFHTVSYIGWIGQMMKLLKEKKAEDILLFIGGAIPQEDQQALEDAGVKGVFRPGTSLREITDSIIGTVKRERWKVVEAKP